MRKLFILFLIIVLCLFYKQAQAQRYLKGMKAIEFRIGSVDGFLPKDSKAFYGGIGMSVHTKRASRWVFQAEYLQKKYEYKDVYLPISQFTGECGHYFSFLSNKRKSLFFSVGASVMAGYEMINNGKKVLYDGSSITNDGAMLYGGSVMFETEWYLGDYVILLLNARERILWGSTVGKFHAQIGLGLKFIIN